MFNQPGVTSSSYYLKSHKRHCNKLFWNRRRQLDVGTKTGSNYSWYFTVAESCFVVYYELIASCKIKIHFKLSGLSVFKKEVLHRVDTGSYVLVCTGMSWGEVTTVYTVPPPWTSVLLSELSTILLRSSIERWNIDKYTILYLLIDVRKNLNQ